MMRNKYYAGIGSRELPEGMESLINAIGRRMAEKGYILRSGAADGADNAFEQGCIFANGKADIYLPWRGFKGRWTNRGEVEFIEPLEGQREISRQIMIDLGIITYWDKMSETSQKFHSRNVNQIEGRVYEPDVSVVIYYAPTEWISGQPVGGTRTAVMLARIKGIPTYNLFDEVEKSKLLKILEMEEDL